MAMDLLGVVMSATALVTVDGDLVGMNGTFFEAQGCAEAGDAPPIRRGGRTGAAPATQGWCDVCGRKPATERGMCNSCARARRRALMSPADVERQKLRDRERKRRAALRLRDA